MTDNPQDKQRVPGFACPHCGQFMPVPTQQLLHQKNLVCPWCHYRLEIDRQMSEKVQSILDRVDDANRKVDDGDV